jgi:deoxyribonuclease V
MEPEWNVSPAAAIVLQRELAGAISLVDEFALPPRLVAGIDVGLADGMARAAVVVLAWPQMTPVESAVAYAPLTFPYVPGLLSFREGPAVLAALQKLEQVPDVLLFDGQGYAHPRRVGIATHLGIVLDCPTIGCAKSCLCGTYEEPGWERGSTSPLVDGAEVIGAVVRTRSRVRPLFVSTGHRVSLATAVVMVLRCGGGYRLPEPTRLAHLLASRKEPA